MSKIIIDITKYDRPEIVSYYFTEEEFRNPKKTFTDFKKDNSSFQSESKEKKYEIKLSVKQDGELSNYLDGTYFKEDAGNAKEAKFAIGFSYGENPDVNLELALKILELIKENPKIKIYAQWEIVNELKRLDPKISNKVICISLDYDKDYITTDGIIDKFIELEGEKQKIIVIGQAWHSVRCVETCENYGLIVIGQRVVDIFSESDPQKWVRNAFAWILKEAAKSTKSRNFYKLNQYLEKIDIPVVNYSRKGIGVRCGKILNGVKDEETKQKAINKLNSKGEKEALSFLISRIKSQISSLMDDRRTAAGIARNLAPSIPYEDSHEDSVYENAEKCQKKLQELLEDLNQMKDEFKTIK